MSAFSEAALEKKLSELSNSQQSVQTLSLWLIHHRKHSRPIVTVWERELRKGEWSGSPRPAPREPHAPSEPSSPLPGAHLPGAPAPWLRCPGSSEELRALRFPQSRRGVGVAE